LVKLLKSWWWNSFPHLSSLALEVGPQLEGLGIGSTVCSSSRIWDRVPAEIELCAFKPQNLTSGGNDFNDFPENGDGTASPGGGATMLGGGTAAFQVVER